MKAQAASLSSNHDCITKENKKHNYCNKFNKLPNLVYQDVLIYNSNNTDDDNDDDNDDDYDDEDYDDYDDDNKDRSKITVEATAV